MSIATTHVLARFGTPRLVARTLVAVFGAIVAIFGVVFLALTIEARGRAVRTAEERLEGIDGLFHALEAQRARALALQAALVNRSPAVQEALVRGPHAVSARPAPSLQLELDRFADLLGVGAVVLVNAPGVVVASGGQHGAAWPAGRRARDGESPLGGNGAERVVRRSGRAYRVVAVPLRKNQNDLGELRIATALDDAYARELSQLARAGIVLLLDKEVVGSSASEALDASIRSLPGAAPDSSVFEAGGERYAVRTVLYLGPARFYAVSPVNTRDGSLAGTSVRTIGFLVAGALVLGALGSFWVARIIARPIDVLSQQLRTMARARDFNRRLQATGSSLELDRLTETFNDMMASVSTAEAKTELASVGAIKALAAALDCRDPYTAGHSERVSTLSVLIGRRLRLDDEDLEVLRLGALLHDIGKIGIRDNVLTKAGPLTREEFDIIKTHPTLGAHMLRQVPFLYRHLPIVELHHERPDGRGYPHGLVGHATPLLARIVHVADAFDAMTSARAYRGAQPTSHAIAELWRYAGSQFDTSVVEAFVAAWSAAVAATETEVARPAAAVLRFPEVRPTGSEG